MNTEFLPQNYEAPKTTGSYMKLQDGENKIRILSSPILGWEEWIDKSPVRYRFNEKPDNWNDASKPGKHFWAMLIWNYDEEKIQIFHIHQASIRRELEDLSKDSDWRQPFYYDIKITRSGKDLLTKYTVNPTPHKPIASFIEDIYKENPCRLEALFDSDDPFGQWSEHTECVFNTKNEDPDEKISQAEGVNQLPF